MRTGPHGSHLVQHDQWPKPLLALWTIQHPLLKKKGARGCLLTHSFSSWGTEEHTSLCCKARGQIRAAAIHSAWCNTWDSPVPPPLHLKISFLWPADMCVLKCWQAPWADACFHLFPHRMPPVFSSKIHSRSWHWKSLSLYVVLSTPTASWLKAVVAWTEIYWHQIVVLKAALSHIVLLVDRAQLGFSWMENRDNFPKACMFCAGS